MGPVFKFNDSYRMRGSLSDFLILHLLKIDTGLELNCEAKRKRIYALTGLVISIFFLVGFGGYHLKFDLHNWAAYIDLGIAGTFFVTIQILRNSKNDRTAYRLAMLAISFLFIFNVSTGRTQGIDILWLYTYPMCALFLLGRKEGLYWTVILLGITFLLIQFQIGYSVFGYSVEFKVRFCLTILLVSFFCWLSEALRQYFYTQLKKEKTKLKSAMNEIKTLSGLLPICSPCKKIRDDKGYWNQIENYIKQHSDAEFSHSMCPECSDNFYGDQQWYIKMKKKNKT
jgi:hypothetical protein